MKKVLALALSLALIATLAISGTIAYLTDEEEQVNVMTLGRVEIEQIEQERDADGKLVDFNQAKPALPAVGPVEWADERVDVNGTEYKVFTDALKNVVDKIVTVENTGKSDAFVRTIIAIEAPNYDPDDLIHINHNDVGVTMSAPVMVEIDDIKYVCFVFTYTDALNPGEVSAPSLMQLFLDSKTTNEDCEAFGGTWEVLVKSQAVQAAGFANAETALNTAFGEANTGNVKDWFGEFEMPVAVADAEELAEALAAGEDVYLAEDVVVESTVVIPKGTDASINLGGNDLSYAVSNDGQAAAIITNNGTLEITGKGTISFVAADPDLNKIPSYATNTITNEGTLVIGEGVTIINESEGGASYAVDNKGKFTMNGGTLIGNRCALRIAKFNQDNVEFIMNGGLIKAATPAWVQLAGGDANVAPTITVTINDGTFESTKTSSADNDVLYTYSFGNSHANTSLTINGGKFLGGTVSIGSGYKGDVPALEINGGTFEYDVLQWLVGDASTVLYAKNA